MIISAEIFITLRPKNIYFPDNDEIKPEPFEPIIARLSLLYISLNLLYL